MIPDNIEIHFAPLQGMTDVAFRRLHAQYYGGVDYYYTPFIRIERGLFRKRDLRDLAEETLPSTVAQMLPGSAEELVKLCEPVVAKGMRRIDVNVGCPFPPVMAHGRGSALLNNPDRLLDILRGIQDYDKEIEFSLKMRLGYDSPDQWATVVDAINETPLRHVTMHARIAKQQYKGTTDMEAFDRFASRCTQPIVYNGDILTEADAERIVSKYPQLKGLMIGRGLIADMNLGNKLRGNRCPDTKLTFRTFHSELYNDALGRMTEPRQVAEHFKPYWDYWFQDADKKSLKAIHKAHKAEQYMGAVSSFLNCN